MNFLGSAEKIGSMGDEEILDLEQHKKDEEIEELLKNLDPDQRRAVVSPLEDCLCLAGAGSGKTRVLTYRTVYLIKKYGVPEDNIMLVTFTNKAADEMISRIRTLLDKQKNGILAGTFHHIAGIYLRKYAKVLGYTNDFVILDKEDAEDFIGICRQKFLVNNSEFAKEKEFPKKNIIYSIYTKIKNLVMTCSEIVNYFDMGFSDELVKAVETILNDYEKRKLESNAMDFDDMLINFLRLLKEQEGICEQIRSQYPYLMCDEYQDINEIQNDIITRLTSRKKGEKGCCMMVGDSRQAIYGFRGAKSEYIIDFPKKRKCKVYPIRYNYRSQKHILDLAENFVQSNAKLDNEIIAFKEPVEKPVIFNAYTDSKQAEYIAQKILEGHRDGIPYSEMAVLIRVAYLTKNIEMAFARYNIPYKVVGGKSFFDRKHIRDLTAFLKFEANNADEVSFSRLASLFGGIKETTAEKLYTLIKLMEFDYEKVGKLEKFPFRISKNGKESVSLLMNILNSSSGFDSLDKKIENTMKMFYKSYIKATLEDSHSRIQDVEALKSSAKLYKDIVKFLEDIVLDRKKDDDDGNDKVVISTMHKAKGLEWNVVFLPYVNEDIFPHKKAIEEGNLEEEINLFYVDITRAREKLYIGFISYNDYEYDSINPSRFITSIDEDKFIYKRIV